MTSEQSRAHPTPETSAADAIASAQCDHPGCERPMFTRDHFHAGPVRDQDGKELTWGEFVRRIKATIEKCEAEHK